MDKKSIAWLLNELPQLVSQGVLPPETAESLRRHYGQIELRERKRSLLTIFAVIGFLLIGLGVMLILAHNWDSLTRPARLTVSVGALLLAQSFAGLSLWYKREQASFTESSSVFLTVMIGAAIALVSQTYHLTDDFDAFLLTWILLALPLVYIMRSTAAAVLCLALTAFWALQSSWDWPAKQLAWLLLAAVLPFYKSLWQGDNCSGRRFTALGIAIAAFLPVCFAAVFYHQHFNDLNPFIWPALFAIMYLADVKMSLLNPLWQNAPRPFQFFGCAGIIFVSFCLSFKSAWYVFALEYLGGKLEFRAIEHSALVLACVMLVLFAWLLAQVFHRLDRQQRLLAAAPLAAGLGCVLARFAGSLAASLIFNIYVIAFSLTAITNGIAKEKLSLLNGGMLLLAAIIIARFFDAGISFELRGAAFVLTGLCFLTANWAMVRRIKKKREQV